jgi:predicted kinase
MVAVANNALADHPVPSSHGWRDRGRHEPVFIVVSGPPASGKSTLAPWIAVEFDLPLIAKDTIKDALMSVLPVPDVEVSRQLGHAAVQAMLAIAAASPSGAVLESNFYRSFAVKNLRQLPGVIVEVFCRCDRHVAACRYRTRAGTRHSGHFDQIRTADELWNDEISEPVAGGWTVIEVDTNHPADLPGVAARIRETLGS